MISFMNESVLKNCMSGYNELHRTLNSYSKLKLITLSKKQNPQKINIKLKLILIVEKNN